MQQGKEKYEKKKDEKKVRMHVSLRFQCIYFRRCVCVFLYNSENKITTKSNAASTRLTAKKNGNIQRLEKAKKKTLGE